ncbi:hypothetical protein MTYP_02821 [Methylophilaceae bacterium]|nr:hypothetical protein MTYP_02821 [Methylophilaceae bacterium]
MVDDKWLAALDKDIHGEMDRISQALIQHVKELAERYETPATRVSRQRGKSECEGGSTSAQDGVSGMSAPLAVREAPAKYQVELESQRVKLGYKQTEVGVMPEDWELKQIGDLNPFVTSGSRGWAAFYPD